MKWLTLLLLTGCSISEPGPNVDPYYSSPKDGALIRKQYNESVPYKDTKGWYCHPPRDYEALLNWCTNPSDVNSPFKAFEVNSVPRDN